MSQKDNIDGLEETIRQYTPLVYKIVNRMDYGYVDREDLIQAGLMGLYYAINNYNQNAQTNFVSYASIYIISEIKKELRNNKLIILNKDMIKLMKKLSDCSNQSFEQIAQLNNTTKENVFLAYIYKEKIIHLDKQDDEENSLLDIIPSKDTRSAIIEGIHKLDDDEQKVIIEKYFKNASQSDIAKFFHKSQSYVSRLEAKALKNLKHIIEFF